MNNPHIDQWQAEKNYIAFLRSTEAGKRMSPPDLLLVVALTFGRPPKSKILSQS